MGLNDDVVGGESEVSLADASELTKLWSWRRVSERQDSKNKDDSRSNQSQFLLCISRRSFSSTLLLPLANSSSNTSNKSTTSTPSFFIFLIVSSHSSLLGSHLGLCL